MGLGWNMLGDLRSLKDKAAVVKRLKSYPNPSDERSATGQVSFTDSQRKSARETSWSCRVKAKITCL